MQNATILAILEQTKVIAVVGLSPNPERTSYEVAQYLQNHAYRIIPVNPNAAGQIILGEYCYASLPEAASALGSQAIDMVDVFRKSDEVPPIVQDAILIGAKVLWLQLDIHHEAAQAQAQAVGIQVVVDRCTKIEHRRMIHNV